ncbi:hypothetical protein ACA910_020727 [Epithemia clementina (nom. ined.)]
MLRCSAFISVARNSVRSIVHTPATQPTALRSSSLHVQQYRGIASPTTPTCMPLDEFRDPVPRAQRQQEIVGRPWSVKELRRKNYDDLHKLWIVLYKEKNMLLTELQISRRKQIIFPQKERFIKVRRSMKAIKTVLGERKRAAIAAFAELKMLEEVEQEKLDGEGGNEGDDKEEEEENEESVKDSK